jgi:hypothetical protein
MKKSFLYFLLFALFLCLFVPQKAASQYSQVQTIDCESHHGKVQYCPIADPRSYVVLVQELYGDHGGGGRCVRGETWGNDSKGIWVSNGCKARFEVKPSRDDGPEWWHSGSHGPANQPRSGACFFKNVNFTGEYFCTARGSDIRQVRLDDEISSIKILGHSTVTIYKDPNFSGPQATTDRSISDLHHWRMPNNPNLNWDNRISSARID